ncbi:quinone oxidoreductase family protein [Deinococcus maricopensis]|uniref:NADPH:quinone reductase n=1 Tax=Deinococcus maricopensis (strain DSM 21211 / LMG 22137 / NRRL B-23946 / LB-34) TaxID=709986 RepID=E8U4E8_DEIML|nr:quinone oxidoreductase [Deinococcus maricopensis]ADV65985.1 NADPH:quinone reductase [Deinococcus maricopensis DSM 21211]
MRAVRVHQPGEASALVLDDLPMPVPGPGEARVKLTYAGLNFIDVYHRTGLYPLPLPAILGSEGAGTVDAVGAGVTDVRVGERVAFALHRGTYAEYAVVPTWKLLPVPDGVSDAQAAALLLQGLTAHALALSTVPLKSGNTCLVHAASGGVGLLLTQIARRQGARVLATVGSAEKAALARNAGADEVMLYRDVDFETEVQRLTAGAGVDVVYDAVGRDTFAKGLNVLRPRGTMVLYGAASGPVEPLDPQVLNQKGSLFLTRPTLGHYVATPEELRERAADLFAWLADGTLHLRIDRTFPLAQAAEAHRYIEARGTKGKVLLQVP